MGDPLSARGEIAGTVRLERGDWQVETRTQTRLTATAEAFRIEATLEALEGDACVWEQSWDRTVPRDLV